MNMHEARIELQRNKMGYYLSHHLTHYLPNALFQMRLKKELAGAAKINETLWRSRLHYYNRLESMQSLSADSVELGSIKRHGKPKVYYFDALRYTRYYNDQLKARFLFGDITYVEPLPALQKSRPVRGQIENAVLMKLDSKRHFLFINDPMPHKKKKDMLIGRAAVKQRHRELFFEKHFDNPLCDLGQINTDSGNARWVKPKISIYEHLKYKFILSLEGFDVATNLKWIMSSNSIAVMPAPNYETWFMEGRLIPEYHYIQVKDDFSDLDQKLNFYIEHPDAALTIIENAHQFIRQFFNPEVEKLISLLVLEKYFYFTGQIDNPSMKY